jgi:hypothetical protein
VVICAFWGLDASLRRTRPLLPSLLLMDTWLFPILESEYGCLTVFPSFVVMFLFLVCKYLGMEHWVVG